ncbi:hypothetical protein CEXT_608601 [Caerostris extrusa]|uniref:Uncharacterized protein n=1 Tax=Caerostris extrusa TaxID=172846 RepID=A0AAV4R7T4_CAEEX|nr:hypothetical protein CEXT_608601 [Caerostris extrusa]
MNKSSGSRDLCKGTIIKAGKELSIMQHELMVFAYWITNVPQSKKDQTLSMKTVETISDPCLARDCAR